MQLTQNIRQNLSQNLQLKIILHPQMIQMLKIFQMNYADFLNYLQKETEENIFLEINKFDALPEYIMNHKKDHKDKHLENMISEDLQKSLINNLMTQLNLVNIAEKDYIVAQKLIENINSRGYLENFEQIKSKLKESLKVADRKINSVLKIIQSFEPDGVGARNLKECLLIQIEAQNFENPQLNDIFKKIIKNHLEDLSNRKYQKIAEKLKINVDAVEYATAFIKNNLNPSPGNRFTDNNLNNHIIPSFEIKLTSSKFSLINLEQKTGMQLKISSKYLEMLKDKNLDAKTKKYLQEKLQKAEELVENTQQRQENLQKIAEYIVSFQEDFWLKDPGYLKPLLQAELANKFEVSPSTVSRILASKYIQTLDGVLPLKILCPRNYFGKTKVHLQKTLANLFEKHSGFSDQQISTLLKKQGINIARRTVTKYRNMLEIKSSLHRSQG